VQNKVINPALTYNLGTCFLHTEYIIIIVSNEGTLNWKIIAKQASPCISLRSPSEILMGRLRGRNMYSRSVRTQCGQRRAQQLFGPPGGSLKADIIGPQAAIIKKVWVRSRAPTTSCELRTTLRAPCELCIWARAREMQMSWNYWNGQRARVPQDKRAQAAGV